MSEQRLTQTTMIPDLDGQFPDALRWAIVIGLT